MNHLLHPELFPAIPLVGERAAEALNQRIGELALDDLSLDPRITVGIRTFNEAPKLELLLQDVVSQVVGNEVEIVVVDNESTDHTKSVVKEYGAELLTLVIWNAVTEMFSPTLIHLFRWIQNYHFGRGKSVLHLPRYKGFVAQMHRVAGKLQRLLDAVLESAAQLRFADSTMLPVCRLA